VNVVVVSYKVVCTVKSVNGRCAAGYKVGEKLTFEGYPRDRAPGALMMNVKETDRVCMYALSSMMPYLSVLYRENSEAFANM
jgi:uncharacterized repeat protein (TIGR04076 family)